MVVKVSCPFFQEFNPGEDWSYCISFARPSLSEYGAIEHWAYHCVGKANIDTSALRYGECWFNDRKYAELFMLKWT